MAKIYGLLKYYLLLVVLLITAAILFAQESQHLTLKKPDAIADLRTHEGAALVNAKWFIQPAHITEKSFNLPGPQHGGGDALHLYPTGKKATTHFLHPQAGADDFDNGFKEIRPTELELRQGNGLFSFVWYKVEITIPSSIGSLNTAGLKAIFEIVMDDYSEIWVNGKQQLTFGQGGNGTIPGYNTRNRVLLTNNAKAGDKLTISILGMNGPFGKLPDNYIWVRNAVIDFYKELPVKDEWKNVGKIYKIEQRLDDIIPKATQISKLADGFSFTEGPVWHPDGYLLFSDPNTNTIYRLDPQTQNVSIYISHSGYTGADIGIYHQPGSNGLTIDKEGRLIVAQHGNRRIVRHEKKGPLTILSDGIDGRRLNSPNDVTLRSDGTIYFTDPPYGLPEFYNDARKELDYQGVFMIKNGKTILVAKDCGGPNGIAFSPDEKYLYITNWDIRDIHHTKTLWRYEVNTDGTLRNGKVFYDFSFTEDEEALDGIKVDKEGNLFVSAPGGIWILDKDGKLLGKIVTPERPANMAWGDEDGKTLYLTAHTGIYKIRVSTGGQFSWQGPQ